jgi:hypothetical protein
MDGRMDGWTDGKTDGWLDKAIQKSSLVFPLPIRVLQKILQCPITTDYTFLTSLLPVLYARFCCLSLHCMAMGGVLQRGVTERQKGRLHAGNRKSVSTGMYSTVYLPPKFYRIKTCKVVVTVHTRHLFKRVEESMLFARK